MDRTRGIRVGSLDADPVTVAMFPTDPTAMSQIAGRIQQHVRCNDHVIAVCSEEPEVGMMRNPRATRAATMLIPNFSATNMFVGTVFFFGCDEVGELTDLDPMWDQKLFPLIPIVDSV